MLAHEEKDFVVRCGDCGVRLGTLSDNVYVLVRVVRTEGGKQQDLINSGALCSSCAKRIAAFLRDKQMRGG